MEETSQSHISEKPEEHYFYSQQQQVQMQQAKNMNSQKDYEKLDQNLRLIQEMLGIQSIQGAAKTSSHQHISQHHSDTGEIHIASIS